MPDDRVMVNVTYDAVFSCAATGLPAPTISWQLNGVDITDIPDLNSRLVFDDPATINVATPNGNISQAERILTIMNAAAEDANVYTCIATIEEIPDNDTQNFELYVQGKFFTVIPIKIIML